ncbi:MAG: DUF309 domain-containing protein [Planctomycetota bacterium]|jgi:hypothetical protein
MDPAKRWAPDMQFPPYAYLPGGPHPHPGRDPAGHGFHATTFEEGVDLFHAGFLWEAHEAWEGLWRAATTPERRDFYQGLIQLAAALIQVRIGHERGAAKLLAAVKERLARAEALHGVDLEALRAQLEDWPAPPRLEAGPSAPAGPTQSSR